MKKRMMILSVMAALSLEASESRKLSYAIEDAASRTVTALAADSRVKQVKSIAFVKLNVPDGKRILPLTSDLSQVFEATLTEKPERFTFVTHASHSEEWKLIDGIFDQALDFESYDPKSTPAINKLKLADALLIGQIIDAMTEERENETETSIRIAMRLIKISTGEQLWGSAVTGSHITKIDRIKDIEEKAKSLLTFNNILYALGGLAAFLIIVVLIRKMTRVR